MSDPKKLRDIFDIAIEIKSDVKRQKYLDHVCGDDLELRKNTHELIQAHFAADSFLEPMFELTASPSFHQAKTQMSLADEIGPGSTIGPYKLIRQIGSGGFGRVFLAEQLEPVRRNVAIKLIRAGRDSAEVIARFNHERQALAIMDHPSIATILDAGTTAQGRPYFVMEFVEGVPITEYADDCNMSTEDRLRLFVNVCKAVQHAHQKGVIHRDLKPSNILVSEHDGEPVCKIIDFGIAKAIGPSITKDAIRTGQGILIGTPRYMSPEQATLNGIDVDARSDIYSLGVLLYELLTGTTPITLESFQDADFDELLRMLRETEPPIPSTRLKSSAAEIQEIARKRQTGSTSLVRMVTGDLDWIVTKALDKEPERRYDSVDALARDVERFLADDPIEARPPSSRYRAKKFFKKNRLAVNFSLAILSVLVVATGVSVWQARRAIKNEALAIKNEAIAVKALEAEKRAKAEAFQEWKSAAEARNLARQRFGPPFSLDFGRTALDSRIARIKSLIAMAERLEQPPFQIHQIDAIRQIPKLSNQLKYAFDAGRFQLAVQLREDQVKQRNFKHRDAETRSLELAEFKASSLVLERKYEKAELAYRELLTSSQQLMGNDHEWTMLIACHLGEVYRYNRKHEQALNLMRQSLASATKVLGPDDRWTALYTYWLGRALESSSKYGEALGTYKRSVELLENSFGDNFDVTVQAKLGLGEMYRRNDQPELSKKLLAEAQAAASSKTFVELDQQIERGSNSLKFVRSLYNGKHQLIDEYHAQERAKETAKMFVEVWEGSKDLAAGVSDYKLRDLQRRSLEGLVELASLSLNHEEKVKWENELQQLSLKTAVQPETAEEVQFQVLEDIVQSALLSIEGRKEYDAQYDPKKMRMGRTEARLNELLQRIADASDELREQDRLRLEIRVMEGLVDFYTISSQTDRKTETKKVIERHSKRLKALSRLTNSSTLVSPVEKENK